MNGFNMTKYIFIILIINMPNAFASKIDLIHFLENQLANNPIIKSSLALEESSLFQEKASWRNYLPQLDGNISAGTLSENSDNYNYHEWQIHFGQKIFDKSQISQIHKDKTNHQLFIHNTVITKSKLILEILLLMIDLQEADKLNELYQQSLNNTKHHLNSTEKRYRAGELTKTDVWQSKNRYQETMAQLQRVKLQRATVIDNFQGLTDSTPPSNFIIINKLNIIFDTIKLSNQTAIDKNPIFKNLSLQNEINHHNYKIEQAGHYPVLSLKGSYSQLNPMDNKYQEEKDGRIFIDLEIPIFSSGKISAIANTNYYRWQASEYNLHRQRTSIKKSMENELEQIENLKNRIETYEDSLRSAEKALFGINKEFAAGTKGSISVLDAQRDLTTTSINLYRTKMDMLRSQYVYLWEIGSLNLAFIRENLK